MAWAGPPVAGLARDTGNVALFIPHQGRPSMGWTMNLRYLDIPVGTPIITMGRYPIDVARDQMGRALLNLTDRTYGIFLDMDVRPPQDFIQRLLAVRGDIVAGVYPARKDDMPLPMPAVWRRARDEKGITRIEPYPWTMWGVHKADYTGMGFIKIHRRVFETVPRPWFYWTRDRWENGREVENGVSEDFYFFDKAREYGFELQVDFSLRAAHELNALADPDGNYKVTGD